MSADAGSERTRAQQSGRWFRPLADHMGRAYLRYSFTKGTEQEADFLVELLGLGAGSRVLDAGCGPGRHVRALQARGHRRGRHGSGRVVLPPREPGATLRRQQSSPTCGPFPSGPGSTPSSRSARAGSGSSAGRGRLSTPMWERSSSSPDAFVPGARSYSAPSRRTSRCVTSSTPVTSTPMPASCTSTPRSRTRPASTAPPNCGPPATPPASCASWPASPASSPEHVWSVDPGDYARRPPDLDHAEYLLVARRPA